MRPQIRTGVFHTHSDVACAFYLQEYIAVSHFADSWGMWPLPFSARQCDVFTCECHTIKHVVIILALKAIEENRSGCNVVNFTS